MKPKYIIVAWIKVTPEDDQTYSMAEALTEKENLEAMEKVDPQTIFTIEEA